MKNLKGNMIFLSIVYLALGGVLLCWPEAVLNIICYVVGGLVILGGVMQLAHFFSARGSTLLAPVWLVLGLVCLALGLFLIVRSDIVQIVLPVVFGLFVIFDSVVRLQNALELRRCGHRGWLTFGGLALLSVALGLVMVCNPFGAISTLVMAIGVILCIEGALNLLSMLYTALVVRRYLKRHPVEEAKLEELTGLDLNGDGVVAAPVTPATVEGTAVEVEPASDPEQQP